MKINKKIATSSVFVLSALCLSAAIANVKPAKYALAETQSLDIDYYDIDDSYGLYIEIGTTYNEKECSLSFEILSDSIDGEFSIANSTIGSSDIMFNAIDYSFYYYEFNYFNVTITDIGDTLHSLECEFSFNDVVIEIAGEVKYYSETGASYEPLTIDSCTVDDSYGIALSIETTLNEQYRELYIQLEGEAFDGTFSLADETISAWDSCFMGENYEPYNFLDNCDVTIVDLGNNKHSVTGTFVCDEGAFSFDTEVEYEVSGGGTVEAKNLKAISCSIEAGFFSDSITMIGENGEEIYIDIYAGEIESGVEYDQFDSYYTRFYPNFYSYYQVTAVTFKQTVNFDCSQKIEVVMTLENGEVYNITYTNDHTLKETHEAVNPTCIATGTKEYFECLCGTYFEDSEFSNEIGDVLEASKIGPVK